jgi:hypothetical protein
VAGVASADPIPSLDLRGFHPSTDPASNLYLEPTATPGSWQWNVAAWASYANRLVTITDATGKRVGIPVEHQFSMDYAFGIGIGERLALGLTLPTVMYQSGTSEALIGADLPQTALGDLGLQLKATLLPSGELGGFSLAALGRMTLPTGNARSYLAEQSVIGRMSVATLLGKTQLSVDCDLAND